MTEFDPTAPLPGPPDPWDEAPTPSLRSGPPFHMTDMIAAEPAFAVRLITRFADPEDDAGRLAAAIRSTIGAGDPVILTGCGTSEHGARAAGAIIREAAAAAGLRAASVHSEEAFELSLAPPDRGLVIGISHEGGTAATLAVLQAAGGAGCRTAVITVSRRSPAGSLGEMALETGELDQGWCHTVGYLSPILAAAAVGAHLSGRPIDPAAVDRLLTDGAADTATAETMAAGIAKTDRLLVIASGADRTAGRELVLKVEEAAWLPSAYRDLETFLHGHIPATGPTTSLILVLTDRDRRPERIARARQALAAAAAVGIRAGGILSQDASDALDSKLTPLGRLVVEESLALPAPVAALVGTTTPLQLLTERLARARGTNPDLIRRDDPTYRAAADAAGN